MQTKLEIQALPRTEKGKQANKLRRAGNIPAVLYGHKIKESLSLTVGKKEFEKLFADAGESTLVSLAVKDGASRTVLVHDVQHHVLTGDITHVDFYEVDMTEKIHANVPLEFSGESKAVKDLGGTFTKNLAEIEVESLPGDLPHNFVVDISKLATFEDTVTIADLQVDENKVRIMIKPETIIAKVTPPRTDEELAALSEQPVEDEVSQVEGIEKKEEGEAEAEPEKKEQKETKEE